MTNVFIDGSAGTTGLRIRERLSQRRDLALIELPEELRKDVSARKDALNRADIAFLCLPDAAAMESVSLIENPQTVVIDTSTAHRTASGWSYGFPELAGRREQIKQSKWIANPGCHASGFIALTEPLIRAGVLPADISLSCVSLTGYSGGGKNMIAAYESPDRSPLLEAPRMYGLGQTHKHLKEMTAISGLTVSPVFCPIVAPFYSGMEVTVPLSAKDLPEHIRLNELAEIYRSCYTDGVVHYADHADEEGFLSAGAFSGKDNMQITVCGNEERILLVARYDNLGKGASGAAIQNMNLVLDIPETTGLNL